MCFLKKKKGWWLRSKSLVHVISFKIKQSILTPPPPLHLTYSCGLFLFVGFWVFKFKLFTAVIYSAFFLLNLKGTKFFLGDKGTNLNEVLIEKVFDMSNQWWLG